MRLALLAPLALLGCGPAATLADASILADASMLADASSSRDASGSDARPPDAQDAGPIDDAGDPGVRPVGHARQIRGVWVPSVYNIVFPSRTGLSETQARAELVRILDALAEARMNALFLQVRPESDALYASSLEPWSRFLTGTQGRDPGWDPLAIALEEAHARGIEVHAWMNPYRGLANAASSSAPDHVTRTLAAHAVRYGSAIWMDPGAPAVREHVVAVVRDLVARYDVDGVHFDDYFYPYPVDGTPFPDDASYAAYVAGGGALARDDWRRQNVHDLVREVSEAIRGARDDVRFGISPFGIYRPGMPPGIVGLDAYASIYCDPLPWIEHAWIDYLAPQLYWPTTQTAQAFEPLLDWWAGRAMPATPILAGINLVRLGASDAWTLDEFRAQYRLLAERADRGVGGSIAYHAGPLLENRAAILDVMREEIHAQPALPPPLPSALDDPPPAPPTLRVEGNRVRIAHSDPARVRWVVVYRDGDPPSIVSVHTANVAELELPSGIWWLSAVDRRGLESLGRRAVVE